MLEIMNTTKLIERQHQPGQLDQDLNSWDKVLRFFGFESKKGREPDPVVYLLPEWDYYGRVGTLKPLLHKIWGEWPLGLIAIIVRSVFGGLALLYGMYKFTMLVYRSPPHTRNIDDEEGKWDERGRLLDVEGEEETAAWKQQLRC
jgi:hypothetical protein